MNTDDQQPRNKRPWMIQTKKKVKQGTVTHRTMKNNIVSEQQKGQECSIMISGVPASWSHDEVLKHLNEWGQVLEISIKKQHKYQLIWTRIVLKPLIDTNYILRTWWQKLGNAYVRWYSGNMRLKDCKQREQFQAKMAINNSLDDEAIATQAWADNKTVLELLKAKAWKIYKSKNKEGEVCTTLILYFSSQNLLLDALSFPDLKEYLVQSSTPAKKQKQKQSAPSSSEKKSPKQVPKETKKARSKTKTPSAKETETRALINALIKLLT
jgi:hypothetical protein